MAMTVAEGAFLADGDVPDEDARRRGLEAGRAGGKQLAVAGDDDMAQERGRVELVHDLAGLKIDDLRAIGGREPFARGVKCKRSADSRARLLDESAGAAVPGGQARADQAD